MRPTFYGWENYCRLAIVVIGASGFNCELSLYQHLCARLRSQSPAAGGSDCFNSIYNSIYKEGFNLQRASV
eukprot:4775017-Prymnesium_polylepis.1